MTNDWTRRTEVKHPTVAQLIEALQTFPPEYVVWFNPADAGDMTHECLLEIGEGTTNDGPGFVHFKLVDEP